LIEPLYPIARHDLGRPLVSPDLLAVMSGRSAPAQCARSGSALPPVDIVSARSWARPALLRGSSRPAVQVAASADTSGPKTNRAFEARFQSSHWRAALGDSRKAAGECLVCGLRRAGRSAPRNHNALVCFRGARPAWLGEDSADRPCRSRRANVSDPENKQG
jgi:hypothetical protein